MIFSQVEYLIVFISIIYGFVAAEYFYGWGGLLLKSYKNTSLYYILWTVFEFVFMITLWWGSWIRSTGLTENITYFFLTLTTPLLLYLIGVITFPSRESVKSMDVHAYFLERFPKIAFLYFLLFLTIIPNLFLYDRRANMELEVLVHFSGALIALVASIRKERFIGITILTIGSTLLLFHIIFVENNFAPHIGGLFSHVEYLNTFVAIIYGYATAEFFLGWGILIRGSKLNEINWFHIAFTALAFIILVDLWWSGWNRSEILSQNILYFFSSLAPPLILYFLGLTLFSTVRNREKSFSEQFKMAPPLVFFLLSLLFFSNIMTSVVFGELDLLHFKNVARFGGACLGLIGAFKRSRSVHVIILITGWIFYFIHLFANEIIAP
ncbi:MAG: hypothetical protein OEY51_02070 [Cyclobacteriaceae bacterium]|nr:hypothetical protein [Cyclobacteriaceae bacterium]